MHIDPILQAVPGQRAVHRAGIHINVVERLRHELRISAFAAGAGTVDGNDYWRIQCG